MQADHVESFKKILRRPGNWTITTGGMPRTDWVAVVEQMSTRWGAVYSKQQLLDKKTSLSKSSSRNKVPWDMLTEEEVVAAGGTWKARDRKNSHASYVDKHGKTFAAMFKEKNPGATLCERDKDRFAKKHENKSRWEVSGKDRRDQREAQGRVTKRVEATRIKSTLRLAVHREVMLKRAAFTAAAAAAADRLDEEEEERERQNSSFPT